MVNCSFTFSATEIEREEPYFVLILVFKLNKL